MDYKYALVGDPLVISEFNQFKGVCPWIIYDNEKNIVELKGITINNLGKLNYINDKGDEKSVSSYIQQNITGHSVRWLDHLYFINGWGKIIKFKNHLRERHGLYFS